MSDFIRAMLFFGLMLISHRLDQIVEILQVMHK